MADDALPWDSVAANPEYQSLPDEQKSAAQQQYFNSVVAPKVPKQHLSDAQGQFQDYVDTLEQKRQANNGFWPSLGRIGAAAVRGGKEGWGETPPSEIPEQKPGEPVDIGRAAEHAVEDTARTLESPFRVLGVPIAAAKEASAQAAKELERIPNAGDVYAAPFRAASEVLGAPEALMGAPEVAPFGARSMRPEDFGIAPELRPGKAPAGTAEPFWTDEEGARHPTGQLALPAPTPAARPAAGAIAAEERPALPAPGPGPTIEAGPPGRYHYGEAAGNAFTAGPNVPTGPKQIEGPPERPALPAPDTTYGEGFTARPAAPPGPVDKLNDVINTRKPGDFVNFVDAEKATGVHDTPTLRSLLNDAVDRGQLVKSGTRFRVAAPAETPPPETPPAPIPAAATTVSAPAETPKSAPEFPAKIPESVLTSPAGAPPNPMPTDLAVMARTPPAQPAAAKAAPTIAAPSTATVPMKPLTQSEAITSTGKALPVQYALVEANDLVTSHNDDLSENKGYPAGLQPRDRSRNGTELQIQDILNPSKFRPELLGETADAANGAPIIGLDGLVESGNARSMALRRAYGQNLPAAQAYRTFLEGKGYPVEGMKAPVLVRVNRQPMSGVEREAFARDANRPAQLAMSSTERALADAKALPDHVLDLAQPDDLLGARNRQFVREVLKNIASTNELGSLVGPDGALSQDGVRRVQGALLAKAYGNPSIIETLTESADSNYKAIGGAMLDVAPEWAKMRTAAASGAIPPELDITPFLTQAVGIVARARTEGRNVIEYVKQQSMFGPKTVPAEVESLLSWMLGAPEFSKQVGRAKIADAARYYATEAMKAQPGPGLFGETAVRPGELMEAARGRQQTKSEGQGDLLRPGTALEKPAGAAAVREGAGKGGTGGVGKGESGGSGVGPAKEGTARNGPLREGLLASSGRMPSKPGRDLMDNFKVNFPGVKPGAESHLAAANYVRQAGAATGMEYMTVFNPRSGLVEHAMTSDDPQGVAFNDRVLGPLQDADNVMVIHHNHPAESALSSADLRSLSDPGLRWIVAHSPDGTISAARLTDAVSRNLANVKSRDDRKVLLNNAVESARQAVLDRLVDLHKHGVMNVDEGNKFMAELYNRLLEQSGVTHYISSQEFPAHLDGPFTRLIQDAMKEGKVNAEPYRPARPVRSEDGMGKILADAEAAAAGRHQRATGNPEHGTPARTDDEGLAGGKEDLSAESQRRLAERQDKLALFGGKEEGRFYGGGPGTDELLEMLRKGIDAVRPKPNSPEHEFVRALEDRLHAKVGGDQADAIEAMQWMKGLPAEARTPEIQERIYHAIESEILGKAPEESLTPAEQAIKEKFVDPIRRAAAREFQAIKKLAGDEKGVPAEIEDLLRGYVHNIVAGKGSVFDRLDPSQEASRDPFTGGRGLSKNASATKNRSIWAAQYPDGRVEMVYMDKGAKEGDPFIDGKTGEAGVLRRATTKEKEEGTPLLYHKNAIANSLLNMLQLRRARRNMELLEDLKGSDAFKSMAHAPGDPGNAPPSWRASDLPQLRGYMLHPKLANALDDFFNRGPAKSALERSVGAANRFIISSLFIDPIAGLAYHGNNITMQWLINRGWDNFLPRTWGNSVKNFGRAVDEVKNLGPIYRQFLRSGAGLMRGSVEMHNLYDMMLRLASQELEKSPMAGTLAKAWEMKDPRELGKALLETGHRWLWGYGDILMMQRYFDLTDRGMPREQAIRSAEQDIPNYRVPSEAWDGKGGRAMSELMQNPAITVFGRYHYGLLKSMADMARKTVGGSGPDRAQALGKILTLGVLAFAIQPIVNQALQSITGNKHAEWPLGGLVKAARGALELTQGQRRLQQTIGEFMTPSPAAQAAAEAVFNMNFWNGERIRGETDSIGHQATEMAMWAAEKIHTLQELVDWTAGKWNAQNVAASELGLKLPTSKQAAGKEKAIKREREQDKGIWHKTMREARGLMP